MQVIAVINYKGGVGKTTLTANLAAELAWRGLRVLLIDMDPQTSLSFSFIRPEEWNADLAATKTIKQWFDSFGRGTPFPLGDLIIEPQRVTAALAGRGKLALIASHLGLINVDLELATELGGASLEQAKRNFLRVHRRLLDGIRTLPASAYDLVLIDCPPNFNVVTKTAIVASDQILIPAKPDYLSTMGIDYLQQSLQELVKNYNEFATLGSAGKDVPHAGKISPRLMGVVFTMVQEYGGQPIAAMRPFISQTKQLGVPVFAAYIKENKTLFADAPQYGVPVVLTAVAAGTHQGVVDGLEEVVTEFMTKLWPEAAS